MSRIRQNYSNEGEIAVNNQINAELRAGYVYMSIAWYFDRDDVALPGFHKFFLKQAEEERHHAEKLMKYQNSRGGRIRLDAIAAPERNEWGSGLDAMKTFVDMEKNINTLLLNLHKLAESANDSQMAEFLVDEFLNEQVETIKTGSDYVTQLIKAGPGLGEFMFDREVLQESS